MNASPPCDARLLDFMTDILIRNGRKAAVIAVAEDVLARNGYAIVSPFIGALIGRAEAGLQLSESEWAAIMYAIYAGPYGDYFPSKVMA